MINTLKGGLMASLATAAAATTAVTEVGAVSAAIASQNAPTWGQLSMLLGATVFGLTFLWYAKRVLVVREEYAAFKEAVEKSEKARDERCRNCITRERYDRDMKRVDEELARGRTSVDDVVKAVRRVDWRAQRLGLHITAIAVKLGVSVEDAAPPDEEGA